MKTRFYSIRSVIHCILLGILLSFTSLAHNSLGEGTLIQGITAYAHTQYESARRPARAVDGSGLSADGTHTNDRNDMWMGKDSGSGFAKWFAVDLGDTYPLDSIKIWNFNMDNYTFRGLKQIDIFVSTESAPNISPPNYDDSQTWTLVKENHILAQANGQNTYRGDTPIAMNNTLARWVLFRIDSVFQTSGTGGYGGLSEVQFYYASTEAAVTLDILDAPTSSSVTLHGSIISQTPNAYPVRIVYGTAADGSDPALWPNSTAATSFSAGPFSLTLPNLEPDTSYSLALALDLPSETSYSRISSFQTGAISISAPAQLFECEPAQQTITFTRPSSCADFPITVPFSISGSAIPGTDLSDIPESVSFAAGQTSVSIPFYVFDNTDTSDPKTLTLTIGSGPFVGGAATSISILDDESTTPPITCTWTGRGDGTSWEDPDNWDSHTVPRLMDDVVFTDAGLSNGGSILLSAPHSIRSLSILTPTAFSFQAAPDAAASLTFADLVRPDLDATEGFLDFRLPINFYAISGTNCTWDVAGSNAVRIYDRIRPANSSSILRKIGPGELTLLCKDKSETITWLIEEGTLGLNSQNCFRGNLHIGGTDASAYAITRAVDVFVGSSTLYVYHNGSFNGRNHNVNNSRLSTMYIYDGGHASVDGYYTYRFYMRGGTIDGYRFWSGGYTQCVVHYASEIPSIISAGNSFSKYYDMTFDIADGPIPVDMTINGSFAVDATDDKRLTKKGTGTLRTTVGWDVKMPVSISAGTWLVDNTSGLGIGTKRTSVTAGATLGGTGFLSGSTNAPNATIALRGTNGNLATLAPGSIQQNSGEHVYGTLNVGSNAQTNNVEFNEYTCLAIHIGEKGAFDALEVKGAISIDPTGTELSVTLPEDATHVTPGDYLIASASNGISGSFASLSANNSRVKFFTSPNAVYAYVCPLETLILVR